MSTAARSNWRGYLFVAPATVYLAVFLLLQRYFVRGVALTGIKG